MQFLSPRKNGPISDEDDVISALSKSRDFRVSKRHWSIFENRRGRIEMAAPTERNQVDVVVENLLGQQKVVTVRKTDTIRQLKEAIEAQMKVRASMQTLIRRQGSDGSENGYTPLDDNKTVDQYKLGDGGRVLLVTALKSAPPGYELRDAGPARPKLFIDAEGDTTYANLIDRALAERNLVKDPNCIYFLMQLPENPQGTYTVLAVQRPSPPIYEPQRDDRSSDQESRSRSISGESSAGVERKVTIEQEQEQDQRTKSAMDKIRAKMENRKMKKKQLVKKYTKKQPIKYKKKCPKCAAASCKCGKSSKSSKSSHSDPSGRRQCVIS